MKTRYKPGDKVTVRHNITRGRYGEHELGCVDNMVKLAGETFTVTQTNYMLDGWFRVHENDFAWCDEMVVPAERKSFNYTDEDKRQMIDRSNMFFEILS